jgi:hypothetical protein
MGRIRMHIWFWWESQKERKKPQGRISHGWEDNIKTVLTEIGRGVIDWIKLPEDRDQRRDPVNMEINLRVPENVRKFVSSWETGEF